MRINIVSDAHWESQMDRVVRSLSFSGYKTIFDSKDYGIGLKGISIVLMCRDPSLAFERRIRFVRREKRLYIDIMFDLNAFRDMDDKDRTFAVLSQMRHEVPAVLRKYSIPQFDCQRFVEDFIGWLNSLSH
jgi:hypothetical protein